MTTKLQGLDVRTSQQPRSTVQVPGGRIELFDASYSYPPIPGNFIGVEVRMPQGIDWRRWLRNENVTQDAQTKLLTIPSSHFMNPEIAAMAENGEILAAIVPDGATEIGKLHLVTGPRAQVRALGEAMLADATCSTEIPTLDDAA